MIRLLLLFGLLTGLLADGSIDKQIKDTSTRLKKFDAKQSSANLALAKTAKAILIKKRIILKQEKRLQQLGKRLEETEEHYQKTKKELATLRNWQGRLSASQMKIAGELEGLLARIVTLSMLHDDNNTLSPEGVMAEAILHKLNAQTQERIGRLTHSATRNRKMLQQLEQQGRKLRKEIDAMEAERTKMRRAREVNRQSLKELRTKETRYKEQIRSFMVRQRELQKTLEKLNIIKQTRELEALEAARKARNQAILESKELPRVKQHGQSYHRAKTRRYRGKKTIAPLDEYTVIKKYGTYTDPVYNIKIFNESVTLKSKKSQAKVKAVFDGKVILAQNTPMLDNVVIIEHRDGMHTIYAHLDQIAPTVRKGKRLRRGSVIGRVNDQLMFEVTQKNFHIDPLQLIK